MLTEQEQAIDSYRVLVCNGGKYKAGKLPHTGLYTLISKKMGHDYVTTFPTLRDLTNAMNEILELTMWEIAK